MSSDAACGTQCGMQLMRGCDSKALLLLLLVTLL